MTYVYIDESGKTTAAPGEKALVVASFSSKEPNLASKAFKKWRSRKFPRSKQALSEIKFSTSGISSELRLKTLKHIASLDIEIRSAYFKCENVPSDFTDADGPHDGRLYVHAIEALLRMHLPIRGTIFIVCCDRRHIKGMTVKKFTASLEALLFSHAPRSARIEVTTDDSAANANLQVADWIVGAMAAHINGKPDGEMFYYALEPKFAAPPLEIFKGK